MKQKEVCEQIGKELKQETGKKNGENMSRQKSKHFLERTS
jgi:hypothetical protein